MTVQEIKESIATLELCREALERQGDHIGAASTSMTIIGYKNLLRKVEGKDNV